MSKMIQLEEKGSYFYKGFEGADAGSRLSNCSFTKEKAVKEHYLQNIYSSIYIKVVLNVKTSSCLGSSYPVAINHPQ